MMDFAYTEEQELLRREIIRFARASLNEDVIERDREAVFRHDLWKACAAIGLAGLPAPVAHGGSGLDPLSSAIALEALGYGCTDHGLVFGLCAHVVSCVVPLWKFGTEAQQRRYLPGLCDGSLVGAHAMTEPDAGSDAFAMHTRAVRDGNSWRLSGSKTFVSNGSEADVAIVFAITDPETRFHGGITAYLIDRDTAGFSIGRKIDKMGLRTCSLVEYYFDDVSVTDDAVLGGVGAGAGVFNHSMDWERVCLFAAHVGQIERLMERAIAHAKERRVGGAPIGKHQAISHKIADIKIRLEAARMLVYRAATRLERTRGVALDAAISKVFVSEALVQTALDIVQILGGYGYATEYEVERALRDAVGAKIYSGTSEVQRNIIAAWLGL